MSGEQTVQSLTQTGTPLDLPISPLLSAGWRAFQENWIVSLLLMLIWWVFYLIIVIVALAGKNTLPAIIVFELVSPLPLMMLIILYVRRNLNQDVSSVSNIWSDVTVGLYVRYYFGSILVGLLVGLGYFLLILPGVYLAVCWTWWSADLIYNKKSGSCCDDIWSSMSASRAQVIRNWCSVFLLVVILFLILLASSFTIIGTLIVVPVTIFTSVEGYLYAIGKSSINGGFTAAPEV